MGREKSWWSVVIVGLILLLVGATAFYVLGPQTQPHTTLHLGDGIFKARVVQSVAERERGLSGTSQLAQNQAMILVFDGNGRWPIWMKDMNYPLDIVWLNQDKKVIYIVKNAPPDSYPKTFLPKDAARYVVELPAGMVDQKTITVGTEAGFDENNLDGVRR